MTQVSIDEWLDEPCPVESVLLADGHCWINQVGEHTQACHCQGTGKRQACFWKRCPAETQHCGNATCEDCRDCYEGCDGSGFVLDVTLEKLLVELLKKSGQVVTLIYDPDPPADKAYGIDLGDEGLFTFHPTLLAAGLDALRHVLPHEGQVEAE